jgi:hypothetical protein
MGSAYIHIAVSLLRLLPKNATDGISLRGCLHIFIVYRDISVSDELAYILHLPAHANKTAAQIGGGDRSSEAERAHHLQVYPLSKYHGSIQVVQQTGAAGPSCGYKFPYGQLYSSNRYDVNMFSTLIC